MAFAEDKCVEFLEKLGAKEPTPGGGGASALVGATAAALGRMVGNYTLGKEKYADAEDEILEVMENLGDLYEHLCSLVDRDAEVFEPLSDAYKLPKDAPNRSVTMENALRLAVTVPLDIMCDVCSVLELLSVLAEKGSTLVVSDAGVAAACGKAALQGGALNVFINTKTMEDRDYADLINEQAQQMLEEYGPVADEIFASVLKKVQ